MDSQGSGVAPTKTLSPQSVLALGRTIADFPPLVRARGRTYVAEGRVSLQRILPAMIEALVRGTFRYPVCWEFEDDEWISECTCPAAPSCKHCYAVASVVLRALGGESEDGAEHAALPHALDRPVGASGPAASLSRSRAAAQAVEATLLARLVRKQQPWSQHSALHELLSGCPDPDMRSAVYRFDRVLEETDPETLYWRLANTLIRECDGWLPRVLAPYRDRPDLQRRYRARREEGLRRQLLAWGASPTSPRTRELRVVFRLERGHDGDPIVRPEVRVSTNRLVDAPRSDAQLKALRAEVEASRAGWQPDAASFLIWVNEFHLSRFESLFSLRVPIPSVLSLLERLSGSPLASWCDPPAAAGLGEVAQRGGVTAGAPIKLSRETVQLAPVCVEVDGDTRLELALVWPDGRQRRRSDVVYFQAHRDWSRSSLVLADGEFFQVAGEPPKHLVDGLDECQGLSLSSDDRMLILEQLARRFPHLAQAISAHTRMHVVTQIAVLELTADDRLWIRLLARSDRSTWRPGDALPADAVLFELGSDGEWRRAADEVDSFDLIGAAGAPMSAVRTALASATEGAPGAVPDLGPGDAWRDAPDPACVQPIVAWLATLPGLAKSTARARGRGKLTDPVGEVSVEYEAGAFRDRFSADGSPRASASEEYYLRLTSAKVESFLDAWDARPRDVEYFGNERLRRLLVGPTVRAQLRIESSGIDWLSVSAEWKAEGLALSEADLATLRSTSTRYVKLRDGWVRRETASELDAAARALADLGLENGEGEQRLSLWQLAGASGDSLQALEQLGADAETLGAVRELRGRIAAFKGLPTIPVPKGLRAELRPYQRRGLDFLGYAASMGIGAILADDMGLGKTVQALAWLETLRLADPKGGPALVVCPASVMHNWAREAERFVPGMRVLLLSRGHERHALRSEIAKHDLVITNYALLRRDAGEWQATELRVAILDEAQNIKNPDAAVTRAASGLRAHHRLALTGTPLENRALDLWSISSVVNPGYLGSRSSFSARYDHSDVPPHRRALLAARLRPVLLRRLKSEVARDLPDRIEERRDCELTAGQRRLYLAALRRSRALVDELAATRDGIKENRIIILAALTRLRQICAHPALVGGNENLGSGKFDAFFELLEPLLAEGHKVLVFSQFVECLKLLAAEMQARELPFHLLTGQTTKRERVVTAFTEDAKASAFLISLKAGGTGLNLTAASYVVLFDPWWNPAVEAQAIDRAHRIGQDRTVIAYRLIATGTIEEKIFELQQKKAQLVRDVLGDGGGTRSLTRGDLEFLLSGDGSD